jgi:uncharacterized membrane protein (UPF0127 family)
MLAPPLLPGQALWFPACSAVHTAFVRVPIDLLFLQGGRIARICAAVPPWRIVACPGADAVLELAAGEAGRLGLSVGQCLQMANGHEPEGRFA